MQTDQAIPLCLGDPDDFARVRDFFAAAGFDDATVCRALGIPDLGQLIAVSADSLRLDDIAPELRWCVEVFALGRTAPAAASRALCGDAIFDAFVALGLLRHTPANDTVSSPVWVYPTAGFVIASDRHDLGAAAPEDIVFPAVDAGTLRFLALLPAASGDALDLCGGCGIGALVLARHARAAATADVTERSALFAAFNAALNGLPVESLCGDMYGPVAGRTFEVIAAHPPFVPATGPTMVYRDAGATGEDLVRRTVEGLPAHLAPGGTGLILCVGHDTAHARFEERARSWLGAAGENFDVVFGLEKTLTIDDVVGTLRKRWQDDAEAQAQAMASRFRAAGIQQFVYGALALRRTHDTVAQSPLRLRLTAEASWPDLARVLDWREKCRAPGFLQEFAASCPRLAPKLEVTARHVVEDGELVPAEFVFRIADGIQAALRPDPFVVPLIARLDGRRSVADVFAAAQADDALPDGFALDAFCDLVRVMVELGLLQET
jgi:methylase of polypeptide subunit release factors